MVLFSSRSTVGIAIVACSLSSVQARLQSFQEEPSLEDASGFPTSLQDSAGIAEYHNRVCGAILAKGPMPFYELSAVTDMVLESLEGDPTFPKDPNFDFTGLLGPDGSLGWSPTQDLATSSAFYAELGDIKMSIDDEDGAIKSVDEMIARVHGGCESPEDEEMANIFADVAKASEVFWTTTVPEGRFEGRRKLWFWKALKIAFADAMGALSGSKLGPVGAVVGGVVGSVVAAYEEGVIGGGDGDNP